LRFALNFVDVYFHITHRLLGDDRYVKIVLEFDDVFLFLILGGGGGGSFDCYDNRRSLVRARICAHPRHPVQGSLRFLESFDGL